MAIGDRCDVVYFGSRTAFYCEVHRVNFYGEGPKIWCPAAEAFAAGKRAGAEAERVRLVAHVDGQWVGRDDDPHGIASGIRDEIRSLPLEPEGE